MCPTTSTGGNEFLSTPSVGRATRPVSASNLGVRISIHALRGEGDQTRSALSDVQRLISIHALRGEGDAGIDHIAGVFIISIHALRGEGDRAEQRDSRGGKYFYPRPPWGGRRCIPSEVSIPVYFYPRPSVGRATAQRRAYYEANREFLSTPSVGRATSSGHTVPGTVRISIHALRGEGDPLLVGLPEPDNKISIHALRGEGDPTTRASSACSGYFYPRPPWGGRHYTIPPAASHQKISIHALRGEGDASRFGEILEQWKFLSTPSVGRATYSPARRTACSAYFYPRPPWGGRPTNRRLFFANKRFLSTPSVGRATLTFTKSTSNRQIFLSTPSVGRATRQD